VSRRYTFFAAISLALLCTAGICGPPCSQPGVTVAPASVNAGRIAFRKGDQLGEQPLVTSSGRTDVLGICSLRATVGSSVKDGNSGAIAFIFDDARFDVVEGWFSFQVLRSFNDEGFDITIVTSDPRSWPVGVVPQSELGARVTVGSFESCADGECTVCQSEVPGATVRVTVEEAVGGVDGSARKVSDDFKRTVSLEFDLGQPFVAASTQGGESCSVPVEAAASVNFTWDSGAFVWSDGC
jgi:hypothetical protein